jgi:hypothetical protein
VGQAEDRERELLEKEKTTHNTARFFVENRHISWVLLVTVITWGIFGYRNMPKLKDPVIPVRVASAVTPWPGTSAEEIEQLVTRQVEAAAAQSSVIHPAGASDFGIKSLTLPGVSIVQIQLDESVKDPEKEFNDINLKLQAVNSSLPQGAGPVQFNSGFGETSALLLTVASPKEGPVELALRARDLSLAIAKAREGLKADPARPRVSIIIALPQAVSAAILDRALQTFEAAVQSTATASNVVMLHGPGFVGVDIATPAGPYAIAADWPTTSCRTGSATAASTPTPGRPSLFATPPRRSRGSPRRRAATTYRELDQFTDLLQRRLLSVPQVAKILRSGVLPEQVFLGYSQEQLAAYSIQPASIKKSFARNTTIPGGLFQAGDINVQVQPSGSFTDANEIGGVIMTRTKSGLPVYLRDVTDIYRGYQTPPRFLNFVTRQDTDGTGSAIAPFPGIQMRDGEQIDKFGHGRTGPRRDAGAPLRRPPHRAHLRPAAAGGGKSRLFMDALYEAIALVVIVALIGLLRMARRRADDARHPDHAVHDLRHDLPAGIDLQQVSVATLILALGLPVDDPWWPVTP